MSEPSTIEAPRVPTVYFIDDSATMREVMKIAFRRENIGVVACQDATSALVEIAEAQPDVVISDVIMPDKNGFEVCQFIKEHPQLGKTPVILLSGVVNREVTDKAIKVRADELIRKPFRPQDLIARVKQLVAQKNPPPPVPVPVAAAAAASTERAHPQATLSDIFGNAASFSRRGGTVVMTPARAPDLPRTPAPPPLARPVVRPGPADDSRVRLEVLRLESLVKKLQSELAAERDYSRALEAHIKTLQENESRE
jgi:DNA-binding response OmpR family regulator